MPEVGGYGNVVAQDINVKAWGVGNLSLGHELIGPFELVGDGLVVGNVLQQLLGLRTRADGPVKRAAAGTLD